MTNYIGIDIGGTAVKYALLDEKGTITQAGKKQSPKTLEALITCLKNIQNEFSSLPIVGIALSMPGLIDSSTGHAVHGGALTFIRDCNIRDILTEACQTTIHIENDGKCAALGEYWQGRLAGHSNGVALVLGTGIGGGIIVNDQLLKGAHLSAGEFSFIQTSQDFGELKDLFAYRNSVPLLVKNYAEEKDIPLKDMDGKIFFKAVDDKEPLAVKLLEDYCQSLTQQIMNLQTILDPEVITIGGGISKQGRLFELIDYYLDSYLKKVPYPIVRPTVCQSTLGNHANLLGALKNYFIQTELNS